MKTFTLRVLLPAILGSVILGSCSSLKNASNGEFDDMYFTSSDRKMPTKVNRSASNSVAYDASDDYVSPDSRSSYGGSSVTPDKYKPNTNNSQTAPSADYRYNTNPNYSDGNTDYQYQPDYTTTESRGGNTYITNNYNGYGNDLVSPYLSGVYYRPWVVTPGLALAYGFGPGLGWGRRWGTYWSSPVVFYDPFWDPWWNIRGGWGWNVGFSWGVGFGWGGGYWAGGWGPSWGFCDPFYTYGYGMWGLPYYRFGYAYNRGYWDGYNNGYYNSGAPSGNMGGGMVNNGSIQQPTRRGPSTRTGSSYGTPTENAVSRGRANPTTGGRVTPGAENATRVERQREHQMGGTPDNGRVVSQPNTSGVQEPTTRSQTNTTNVRTERQRQYEEGRSADSYRPAPTNNGYGQPSNPANRPSRGNITTSPSGNYDTEPSRNYSRPSRVYTSPSPSNDSYSRPSRTYSEPSAPSRSYGGGSYSSPSPSRGGGGSYSAPSSGGGRSGGSSGPSRR